MNFENLKLVIFDFDGVFTDNKVIVSQNGVESVSCNRSDGLGLSRLKEINIKSFIISTESNPVVSVRAKKLKIPVIQNVQNKDEAVSKLCKELDISLGNTMFVGNDINDIPALKIVGFPVAVFDAYEEILPYVNFKTNKNGGEGAVREICDLIYNFHNNE